MKKAICNMSCTSPQQTGNLKVKFPKGSLKVVFHVTFKEHFKNVLQRLFFTTSFRKPLGNVP